MLKHLMSVKVSAAFYAVGPKKDEEEVLVKLYLREELK